MTPAPEEQAPRRTDMKVKHTPGPWEVFNGSLDVYGPVQPDDDRPNYRRRVTAYPWSNHDDEGRANATLIAAAPDLREAVSTLIQVVEQLVPEPSARGVADVVLSQARAALSKAGGA